MSSSGFVFALRRLRRQSKHVNVSEAAHAYEIPAASGVCSMLKGQIGQKVELKAPIFDQFSRAAVDLSYNLRSRSFQLVEDSLSYGTFPR